jgi:hypothetical protein
MSVSFAGRGAKDVRVAPPDALRNKFLAANEHAGTAGFRLFTRGPASVSRAPCRPGRDGPACGVGGNPAPQSDITKDVGGVFA